MDREGLRQWSLIESFALPCLLIDRQLATAFDGLVYLTVSTRVGHLVLFWLIYFQRLVPVLGDDNAHIVRGRRRISYLLVFFY